MDWQKIGAVAGVAGAALAAVGLLVALVAWLWPQSPSASDAASTTAAPTSTTTTTAAATAPTTTKAAAGFSVGYEGKVLGLPSGSSGSTTFVDLDKPSVTPYGSPAPNELEDAAEFGYDNDGNFSTILTADTARVGFATDDVTTAEQCLDAANAAPIGKEEKVAPGARIDVGTRLCVLTEKRAVALVQVTGLGPDSLWGRSVDLRVTLWRK